MAAIARHISTNLIMEILIVTGNLIPKGGNGGGSSDGQNPHAASRRSGSEGTDETGHKQPCHSPEHGEL